MTTESVEPLVLTTVATRMMHQLVNNAANSVHTGFGYDRLLLHQPKVDQLGGSQGPAGLMLFSSRGGSAIVSASAVSPTGSVLVDVTSPPLSPAATSPPEPLISATPSELHSLAASSPISLHPAPSLLPTIAHSATNPLSTSSVAAVSYGIVQPSRVPSNGSGGGDVMFTSVTTLQASRSSSSAALFTVPPPQTMSTVAAAAVRTTTALPGEFASGVMRPTAVMVTAAHSPVVGRSSVSQSASSSTSPLSTSSSSTVNVAPPQQQLYMVPHPRCERASILGDKYLVLEQLDNASTVRCINIHNQQEFVCKVMSREGAGQSFLSAHYRVDGHPNINTIQEVVIGKEKVYVVFPPCPGGDLHSYVRSRRRLREGVARHLFKQIISAVHEAHMKGIVLRDLKLRKFVFTDGSRTELRLESLEDAVVLDSVEDDILSDKHGCPAYVSPEILKSNTQYSGRAADMWGLGVMLYTMLVGRYPFHGAEHSGLFAKIRRGQFTLPDSLSSRAKCLIRCLLRKEPSERLTSEDVLAHPWLAGPHRGEGARGNASHASSSAAAAMSSSRLRSYHHHHHHHHHHHQHHHQHQVQQGQAHQQPHVAYQPAASNAGHQSGAGSQSQSQQIQTSQTSSNIGLLSSLLMLETNGFGSASGDATVPEISLHDDARAGAEAMINSSNNSVEANGGSDSGSPSSDSTTVASANNDDLGYGSSVLLSNPMLPQNQNGRSIHQREEPVPQGQQQAQRRQQAQLLIEIGGHRGNGHDGVASQPEEMQTDVDDYAARSQPTRSDSEPVLAPLVAAGGPGQPLARQGQPAHRNYNPGPVASAREAAKITSMGQVGRLTMSEDTGSSASGGSNPGNLILALAGVQ